MKFTTPQLDQLRQQYATIERIDPCLPAYEGLVSMLNKLDRATLVQLASANIRFVSVLARNRTLKG